MSDPIPDLIAEARRDIADADRCRALHVTPATGTLHRRLREVADALESEHARAEKAEAGLYETYVALGFDTDGARNAMELFGPMTHESPAEVVVRAAAEHRAEAEADLKNAQSKLRALMGEMARKFDELGSASAYIEQIKAERDTLARKLDAIQALVDENAQSYLSQGGLRAVGRILDSVSPEPVGVPDDNR